MKLHNFYELVLDYIFPPSCGICDKLGEGYLCNNCEKEIEKYLYLNNKKDKFHLYKYIGIIRKRLIQYKFNEKSYLADFFYESIIKNKKACEFLECYDIILPVPIHKKRKRQRGYNQSELIARKIAKKLDLEIYTNVLIKIKNTKPQSLLGVRERMKNAKGVYFVESVNKIKDKNVIILDDIYTTGATANECKKMMKKAGAKKVAIFTIAKD